VQPVSNTYPYLSLQNKGERQVDGARVLVVGEVLWDRLPGSTRLGGAALNFAVHLHRLKHLPLLVSAVGTDSAGEEARRAVHDLGLDLRLLQSTNRFRTGYATVLIDPSGHPSFAIERPAAFDGVEWTDGLAKELTGWSPSWSYYGTLFPSYPSSRDLLFRLLRELPDAARFYDLNLRRGFDSPELVESLLRAADVVKLNEAELKFAHESLGLPSDPERFCRVGAVRYDWRACCITLGARGCAMLVADDYVEADGVPAEVADTVGTGDAFAAAFLHGLISEWPAAQIAESSNRLGAFVASIQGAIPDRVPHTLFDP
jgi:fructokinase